MASRRPGRVRFTWGASGNVDVSGAARFNLHDVAHRLMIGNRLFWMNRFSRRVRLLCLLALLQVAGGPLVLVGVAALGKVMVKETLQHGVVPGVSRALESGEWHDACDLIANAVADHPDTGVPNGTPKAKDLKPNLISIVWTGTLALPDRPAEAEPPGRDPARLISAWPDGPPVPPPRPA